MDYEAMKAKQLVDRLADLSEELKEASLRRTAAASRDQDRRGLALAADDSDQSNPNQHLEAAKAALADCRSTIDQTRAIVEPHLQQGRLPDNAVKKLKQLAPQAQAALDTATNELDLAEPPETTTPTATPEASQGSTDKDAGGSTEPEQPKPGPGPRSAQTDSQGSGNEYGDHDPGAVEDGELVDDEPEPAPDPQATPSNTKEPAKQPEPAVEDGGDADASDAQRPLTGQENKDVREILKQKAPILAGARPIRKAQDFFDKRSSSEAAARRNDPNRRTFWNRLTTQQDEPDKTSGSSSSTTEPTDPDDPADSK